MGVVIRKARASDVAGLVNCIDLAYAGYALRGIDLPPVSEGVADDIRDHHVWVAVEGAKILGGLILMVSEATAKLANIAVHPDHGGRGIGGRLIEAALTACKAAACQEITLVTHAAMPENIRLYQHLGWQATGEEGNKVFMSRSIDTK